MPSTYAHYRIGQEVSKKVSEQVKKVIDENKQLFNIGLHGPDILFYYHPLASNKVNQIGYGMHEHTGKQCFEYFAEVIKENRNNPKYLAYVYGFICHFALDVTCHGYIDDKIAESGISHTEIEIEFDKYLMLADGYDPFTHKLTNHIISTNSNAEIISAFFQNTNSHKIKEALTGMIKYNKLLLNPSKVKRQLVYTLLRISGSYKEMHGLIMNYENNPECEDSTKILRQLYDIASDKAIKLICEYDKYLLGERQSLNAIYDLTFGGKEIENEEQKKVKVVEFC